MQISGINHFIGNTLWWVNFSFHRSNSQTHHRLSQNELTRMSYTLYQNNILPWLKLIIWIHIYICHFEYFCFYFSVSLVWMVTTDMKACISNYDILHLNDVFSILFHTVSRTVCKRRCFLYALEWVFIILQTVATALDNIQVLILFIYFNYFVHKKRKNYLHSSQLFENENHIGYGVQWCKPLFQFAQF